MEVDRGLSPGRLALVVATLGLVTGCSLLESRADPPPPRPLALRSVTPGGGPIGRTPVIRLTFDGYLEDDSFRSYDAAHLQSGGIARGGLAQYSFVHNRLTWRPFSPLPEELRFSLHVADHLEGVAGGTLRAPSPVTRYEVAPERADDPSDEPANRGTPGWTAVSRMFDRHGCDRCHGDGSNGLVPLTYDALVGRQSEQTELPLVAPFDAPDSYLMRKLVWDFPARRYAPQPPPWSERGRPLPTEDLELVERWIDGGAPRQQPEAPAE